jgi:hypothetical protein
MQFKDRRQCITPLAFLVVLVLLLNGFKVIGCDMRGSDGADELVGMFF